MVNLLRDDEADVLFGLSVEDVVHGGYGVVAQVPVIWAHVVHVVA